KVEFAFDSMKSTAYLLFPKGLDGTALATFPSPNAPNLQSTTPDPVASAVSTSLSKASGASLSSASRKKRYLPTAASTPRLRGAAAEPLFGIVKTCRSEHSSANSVRIERDESVDPSSTATIS